MTGQSVTGHRREESQHPGIDRGRRQLGKKDSVNLMCQAQVLGERTKGAYSPTLSEGAHLTADPRKPTSQL